MLRNCKPVAAIERGNLQVLPDGSLMPVKCAGIAVARSYTRSVAQATSDMADEFLGELFERYEIVELLKHL
ncbi:hypothetical protein Pres01_40720 [Metapseudomonas resinovorans]|nr:hypothetical protein Pres01_40720 [Pseudomonas resinovorans]